LHRRKVYVQNTTINSGGCERKTKTATSLIMFCGGEKRMYGGGGETGEGGFVKRG